MSVNVENIAITSIENIEVYDHNDEYIGTLDELNSATLTQGLETVDINGKGGARLMQMKRNKSVEGKASNGVFNLAVAAANLGTEVKRKQSVTYRYHETLTVTSDSATLSYTPTGTELFGVYLVDSNGIATKKFTQVSAAPATGEVKLVDKVLTFFTGDIVGGTTDSGKIVVYYDRTLANATVIENLKDKVAKNVHLVLNALGEAKECGEVYYVQIDVPKASLNGQFDVGGGDSQTMFDIAWTALASRCNGGSSKFWSYIIIDDELVEAAE